MKIGVFDSGLGGLLILRAIVKELPQYDYLYYGDTANLPYGDKSEEEVYELTKAAIGELFARDCLLIIVACNTASAESLRRIQDTYLKNEYPDRKILGVIVPTIEEVIDRKVSRALLLATTRTIESCKYEKELEKIQTQCELVSIATSELVPLIESHKLEQAVSLAAKTIDAHAREGDAVILGCTHYALLKDHLRHQFLNQHLILSQDEVIPLKLKKYLSNHPEITSQLSSAGERQVYLTEHRPDYDRLTAEFLGGAYITEYP